MFSDIYYLYRKRLLISACIYFAFIWSICMKKTCAYKQALTVFIAVYQLNERVYPNINKIHTYKYVQVSEYNLNITFLK